MVNRQQIHPNVHEHLLFVTEDFQAASDISLKIYCFKATSFQLKNPVIIWEETSGLLFWV